MRPAQRMPANSLMALESSTGSDNFLGFKHLHEILDRHLGFSIRGVEGKFLSGRFAGGEDAPVLRRAIFHDRDQLHVSSHSCDENDRQLESADAGRIPVCTQSTAENYALVEASRLRRYAGVLLQSRWRPRRTTWARFVSASAHVQERCRCVGF